VRRQLGVQHLSILPWASCGADVCVWPRSSARPHLHSSDIPWFAKHRSARNEYLASGGQGKRKRLKLYGSAHTCGAFTNLAMRYMERRRLPATVVYWFAFYLLGHAGLLRIMLLIYQTVARSSTIGMLTFLRSNRWRELQPFSWFFRHFRRLRIKRCLWVICWISSG